MMVHPSFDPVALQIGPLMVHWYGLMYLVAFCTALFLGRYRIRRQEWLRFSYRDLDDMLFFGVFGVLIGGRLGFVLFYQPDFYAQNLILIFHIWKGGMSFHGGLIGVIFAMTLFCWLKKCRGLEVRDCIAPLVPTGLAAGRLGNFINGELWGRPTDSSLGMIFPDVDGVPRHPSQLYEFFLEGLALFFIVWLISSVRRPSGVVSAIFLISYGLLRFAVEFSREPDRFLGLLLFDFSMGQWLSLPMVFAGCVMLYFIYRPKR